MSDLDRIKQAMVDGLMTDGDLQWAVDEIERLQARVDELEGAIKIAKGFIGPVDGTMDAWIVLSKALEEKKSDL